MCPRSSTHMAGYHCNGKSPDGPKPYVAAARGQVYSGPVVLSANERRMLSYTRRRPGARNGDVALFININDSVRVLLKSPTTRFGSQYPPR